MPSHPVACISETISELKLSKTDGYILVSGIAYKENTEDIRESPGLKIVKLLEIEGFKVLVWDPCVGVKKLKELGLTVYPDNISNPVIFGICMVQNHSGTKEMVYELVSRGAVRFLIDCKNVTGEMDLDQLKKNTKLRIVKIGSGKNFGDD